MYDTTASSEESSSTFPDDELRRLLQHLIRVGGMLEPTPARHEHGGVRVSMSEVFALGELAEAGSLSQHDLGGRLGLEKSTVSRLAAGMEERGWLTREREPANRRLYRLSLTPLGREVADRVGEDLRLHHGRLLEQLTAAEREGLAVGLIGLVRVLAAHEAHDVHQINDGRREPQPSRTPSKPRPTAGQDG